MPKVHARSLCLYYFKKEKNLSYSWVSLEGITEGGYEVENMCWLQSRFQIQHDFQSGSSESKKQQLLFTGKNVAY